MSKEARDHVRKHSLRKGSEFHLLMAIADYADKDGIAWPSIPRLAKDIRMSERQIKRLVAKLARTDELAIKRNASKAGTHLYQLNMGLSLPLFEQGGGDIASRDNLSGGDKRGQKGVTKRAARGDTAMSPEPLNQEHKRPARRGARRSVDNYTPPAAADLKFPEGTTLSNQQAFLAIAREHKLLREQLQLAFDEVDDRIRRREPVTNVVMLVRAIAGQMKAGTFYGARAERHARATRGGGRPLSAAEIAIDADKGKKAA